MNEKDLVKKLKKALLEKDNKNYESLRKALIQKKGYPKFRDLQLRAFKDL